MPPSESFFVPTVACVRRSIDAIMAAKTSPVTPGYLCVLDAAAKSKTLIGLKPKFRSFFDNYLKVASAPENKPYLVPFGRIEGGEGLLFNRNVAGSYAPSSIRDVNALHDVLTISEAGTFSLQSDHIAAARERILPYPLPFMALSCFLYRDYGFASVPTEGILSSELIAQFGFALNDNLFESGLFVNDASDFNDDDFEAIIVK